MKEERIPYWDNLKFALIVLVVISHNFTAYRHLTDVQAVVFFINMFHMPLFIFISGIFHSNTNIKDRVISMILIGLSLKILNFIPTHSTFDLFHEGTTEWFVFAIAIFSVVTYLIRDYKHGVILILSIIIGCLLGYDSFVASMPTISRIIVWFPFYLFGSMLNKDRVLDTIRGGVRLSGILVIVVFGIICFVLRNNSTLTLYRYWEFIFPTAVYKDLAFYCNGWYRCVYYFFAGVISFGFMSVVPQRNLGIISSFGKRTIQVYFWHIFFRTYIKKSGIGDFLCRSDIGLVLYIILGIGLTFLLSLKIFSFPTKQLEEASKSIKKNNL